MKYNGNKKKQAGNGQSPSAMGEDCIGSQGPQGTVVLEKRQIYQELYTTRLFPIGHILRFLNIFFIGLLEFFKSLNSEVISILFVWGRFTDVKYPNCV